MNFNEIDELIRKARGDFSFKTPTLIYKDNHEKERKVALSLAEEINTAIDDRNVITQQSLLKRRESLKVIQDLKNDNIESLKLFDGS